ncbi:MAG: hypothetical protein GDA54_00270 [Alphaproteobacteria bacterium GM7ARS4]|nr:hypothetical protein [Alphaproteobacteria bacterium GM7ARS4]
MRYVVYCLACGVFFLWQEGVVVAGAVPSEPSQRTLLQDVEIFDGLYGGVDVDYNFGSDASSSHAELYYGALVGWGHRLHGASLQELSRLYYGVEIGIGDSTFIAADRARGFRLSEGFRYGVSGRVGYIMPRLFLFGRMMPYLGFGVQRTRYRQRFGGGASLTFTQTERRFSFGSEWVGGRYVRTFFRLHYTLRQGGQRFDGITSDNQFGLITGYRF